MPQQWMPKSAEPVYMPSSAEEVSEPEKFDLLKETREIGRKIAPIARRLFYGPSEEESKANVQRLNPEIAKIIEEGKGRFAPVGQPSEESLLPEFKQPETYWGGFLNSLYKDYIRPLASESGILGTSVPSKLPKLFGEGVSKLSFAKPIEIAKPRLSLPPAEPQTSFFQGPYGVARAGKTYPLDWEERPLGELGTILPRETGETVQLSAIEAARRELSVGNIPELPVKGDLGEIRTALEQATKRPTQLPKLAPEEEFYVGQPGVGRREAPQLPSAEVKPSRFEKQISPSEIVSPQVISPQAATTQITPVTSTPPTLLRPIPISATPKQAMRQWANGQAGAEFRGKQIIQKQFGDLTDPELITKFERGDRTGRLKDVAAYFDEKWEQGKNLGFLKEDQKRLNYLRHYFKQSPEEVTAAYKSYIAKNPQFAKTGKFPTYEVAQKAGIERRFQTIPEIMGAYETEFQRAVRNKEFYDWLKETGALKIGSISTKPTEWTFKGPNAEELELYVTNFFSKSSGSLRGAGNIGRYTKNLYLGSGIPKTPLNMHFYNTAQSRFNAEGFKGLKDYLSGTFDPEKDIKYLNSRKEFIADLIERGFQHNIEGHVTFADEAKKAANFGTSKVMELANRLRDWQGRVFEDPLFKLHLPVNKTKLAENIYNKALKEGLDRESALRQASTISNDIMGGVDRSLRHANNKDLAAFGLVAPDWLESRYNIAIKGMKALVGKENPIYAKAIARSLGTYGAGAAITGAITGGLINPSQKSSNVTAIPLGKTSTGLNRELPMFRTTSEQVRLPAELARAIYVPGESAFGKASSLLQGRMSTPLKSGMDIILNRDPFGAPLYGKDRFGRPISTKRGVYNIGRESIRPFIPPWVTMIGGILAGEDIEKAIATGAELPLNYNTEPRPNLTISPPK